ncbi:PspC domain-containing protein [Candidatus Saccharibacteria bacterium]|jgi:phage shock protein PspC (stress-responsive transcriptional regulator)|nr:PspC domain-containing protein [Candidatus Saccharibacteria bacterium]
MKEVKRVHLARVSYDIEVGAKKKLETYLGAISKAMEADDDTMHEVELRMIELLETNGVKGSQVITGQDVDLLREKLGNPGDFSEDGVGGEDPGPVVSGRRLMRDIDNAWLGGVCAGVAAFFGINPLWIRLLAVISPFISLGSSILIYVVLWIALPSAKSASDKLEMKGEPVTLSGIKQVGSRVANGADAAKRPLLVVLRFMLALGLMVVAFGVVIALAIALPLGVSAINDSVFVKESPWLIAAGGLALVAAMLFVLLIFMLIYAVIRWGVTRRLGVAIVTVIAAGLLIGGFAIGIGAFVVGSAPVDIEHKKQTIFVPVDLEDVKDLTVDAESGVKYIVRPGAPEAKIKYIGRPDSIKDILQVSRHGDKAEIDIEKASLCGVLSLTDRCVFKPEVIIYGPKLDRIELEDGGMIYNTDNQSSLDVYVHEGSYIQLDRGVVNQLNLKTDDISCEGFSRNTSVYINSIERLILNGKEQPLESISRDCFNLTFNH